ncbi:MAG: IS66 family insertion sequence element accessory protein TnpB [Mesorhizobium sp.]|nr:MAG: IS66 family insertion sequence element accessory protein TnpB [Mesorhizobium sp.]
MCLSRGVHSITVRDLAEPLSGFCEMRNVTRQQIYTWRSELKKKGLLSRSANAVFVPVDMNAVQTERGGDRQDPSGLIELRLTCGRSLCFDSGVNAATLTRLIRAVEAA